MASKSGYKTTMSFSKVGTSTVVELTDVSVTVNHESIEVSDLASVWKERTWGLVDCEVTAKRNYVASTFLRKATSAGAYSYIIAVISPSLTHVFSGVFLLTRATLNMPMGAITEDITLQGYGSVPIVK